MSDEERKERVLSPGLRSRPSLSVHETKAVYLPVVAAVAGTPVPAFNSLSDRGQRAGPPGIVHGLSPGLRSRPSLSGSASLAGVSTSVVLSPGLRSRPSLSDFEVGRAGRHAIRLSPGLRSRPSLSARGGVRYRATRGAVAGTPVPAFVERARWSPLSRDPWCCRRDSGPGLR